MSSTEASAPVAHSWDNIIDDFDLPANMLEGDILEVLHPDTSSDSGTDLSDIRP